MICYVKDKNTFKTKHHATVLNYDMTVKSIYDEVTSVTIPATEHVQKGDYIIAGEYLGIVSEVGINNDVIDIKCADIITMFSRELVEIPAFDSIEKFLKAVIESNYKNINDVMYKMPYLNVIAETQTPFILPEIENDVWSVKSYINRIRRISNVFADFEIERDVLHIRIVRKDIPMRNVDLSTAQYVVTEETYGDQQTGRITAYTGSVRSDWYLLTDGTITTAYTTSSRIDGNWKTLILDEKADTLTEVKNIFAQNSYSHLIEFETDKVFDFYDNVIIRTKKGNVLRSYVSAVRKRKGSRTVYKTGELRIMLDEKINNYFRR